MSLATLLNRDATILHRSRTGTPDAGNNPTVVETSTSARCYLEPTSGLELSTDRSTQIGSHRAFFLPGTVIDGDDRLVVDGHTFDVIGPAEEFKSPTGLGDHLVVQLEEATG